MILSSQIHLVAPFFILIFFWTRGLVFISLFFLVLFFLSLMLLRTLLLYNLLCFFSLLLVRLSFLIPTNDHTFPGSPEFTLKPTRAITFGSSVWSMGPPPPYPLVQEIQFFGCFLPFFVGVFRGPPGLFEGISVSSVPA